MDEIQKAYQSLAARMGDLAFRERDLAAQIQVVQASIAKAQEERADLTKRLSALQSGAPTGSPAGGATDDVATPGS